MFKTRAGEIVGSTPGEINSTALPDRMLKIGTVCEFCDVNPRTVDRWIEDDGFPRPRYIHNVRYWQLSELAAWFSSQPQDGDVTDTRRAALESGRERGQQAAARKKAGTTRRSRNAGGDHG